MRRSYQTLLSVSLASACALGAACKKPPAPGSAASGSASAEAAGSAGAPISSLKVNHGELDTRAPSSSPRIGATVIAATVYKLPNAESRRLGYIRLGGIVNRDPEPVKGAGCKSDFYRVYPMGYVCGEEVTVNLDDPLVRAASKRPDLSKPLPYKYGFVRATSPQYLRIPTHVEQDKSEFQLDEHLQKFTENAADWQKVELGANDVALDARGIPTPSAHHLDGYRPSPELTLDELFGGARDGEPIPFWLEGGRKIPNVSGYAAPEFAIFADRVRRKTGLSLVDAFEADDNGFKRRFAVAVDMRLIPATKIKPDTGSPFHGIELGREFVMPFAWANKTGVTAYQLVKGTDDVRPNGDVPRRAVIPLTGKARIKAGKRFYQSAKDHTVWLAGDDLSIVTPPPEWPEFAEKGEKWIDISLAQQTLVLYEGKRAWYATMVSTGRDRFGDPKETLSTPQGTFRLKSKHIAAMMDSNENSSVAGGTRANTAATASSDSVEVGDRLRKDRAAGKRLSTEDERRLANIEKGRDPEYGVTVRRGAGGFELRDVPWIEYFASGYALHGAYWHDVFGIPRSHGCVNLSPVDARVVFMWTDPPVPEGWHGVNIGPDMGDGTGVFIHR